jgi:hypothetical protein
VYEQPFSPHDHRSRHRPVQPDAGARPNIRPTRPGGSTSDSPEPQNPGSTGSLCADTTLSDRLSSCEGVIRLPSGPSPDNTIEPPETGTTPVIPSPGSPGGN